MSLPSIVYPTFEVEIPSTKKTVTLRPYLVREEKVLHMAQESDNVNDAIRAFHHVLHECSFGSVDPSAMPHFDVEYLFLQLRAKSVDPKVSLSFRCHNDVNGTPCHHVVDVPVNLLDVKVRFDPTHTNKVPLTDDIGVVLKYPKWNTIIEVFNVFAETGQMTDQGLKLIAECIDVIWEGDKVHSSVDYTPEQMLTFVEGLKVDHLMKMYPFFRTMPTVAHTVPFVCDQCGYEDNVTVEGFYRFFV
jgi:hypothetical protein